MNFKLAVKLLKKNDVHCWRKSKSEYCVTNTFFMIKLNTNQFNKFKSKYS